MSKTEQENLIIKSSWYYLDRDIKEAFSFAEFDQSESESKDPCHFIEEESCVQLSQPEASCEPLSLEFILKDSKKTLKKISLVSEASLVEVYGLFGEYIRTCKGTLLEEVDGIVVYSCIIDDIDLSEITLKVPGLKFSQKLWIFGIRLYTQEKRSNGQSRLDMDNVECRLKTMQLTEAAERFKRLVAEYTSGQGGRGVESLLRAGFQRPQPPSSLPFQSSTKPLDIKQYIDASIRLMEQRIVRNISLQLKELELRQNNKLDSIMKILELHSLTTAKH